MDQSQDRPNEREGDSMGNMTNTRDLAAIPRNEKGIEVVSDFFKSLNFGQ